MEQRISVFLVSLELLIDSRAARENEKTHRNSLFHADEFRIFIAGPSRRCETETNHIL